MAAYGLMGEEVIGLSCKQMSIANLTPSTGTNWQPFWQLRSFKRHPCSRGWTHRRFI